MTSEARTEGEASTGTGCAPAAAIAPGRSAARVDVVEGPRRGGWARKRRPDLDADRGVWARYRSCRGSGAPAQTPRLRV